MHSDFDLHEGLDDLEDGLVTPPNPGSNCWTWNHPNTEALTTHPPQDGSFTQNPSAPRGETASRDRGALNLHNESSIDVNRAKPQDVIELLTEGTEKAMSKRPGFVSVTPLASLDKSRVIDVAPLGKRGRRQGHPVRSEAAEYAKRTAALTEAKPGLFTVVGEFTT